MEAHAYNISPREAEAKESLNARVQPGLHSKTLSTKENRKGLTPSYMGKEEKEDVSCQLYI